MEKKFLIMRHGPSFEVGRLRICRPQGRVKLAKNARRFLGAGTISIFTAPEWDTQYTAKCIAKDLDTTEPVVEKSLFDEHDEPVSDEFARKRLADPNPDVIVTHYKRLDLVLAAIEKVTGVKLEIDKARMRHLNRAYLVDLEKGRVLVIKERS
jgi:hypothetical protein